MPNAWLDFWNGHHRIYVNDQHQAVHYAKIAADFIARIPTPEATVVDWGCGDASQAVAVAARARRLILCDAASATRARIKERLSSSSSIEAERIVVVSPDELRADFAASVDLFVVNSVLQYLTPVELDALLADARACLTPGGTLIIADVIPTHDDLIGDIRNLLSTAIRHGFFMAALVGLIATFFSPYRSLRSKVGLARHDEADFLRRLEAAGFKAERTFPNMGFDQRRMAFKATRR